MEQLNWQSLGDYGRIAWAKTKERCSEYPTTASVALADFDHRWGDYEILCHRSGNGVIWA